MPTDPILATPLRVLIVDLLPGYYRHPIIKVRAMRSMRRQCTRVAESQGLSGRSFYAGMSM